MDSHLVHGTKWRTSGPLNTSQPHSKLKRIDKIRLEKIHGLVHRTTLAETVKARQLRWLGHIKI